MIVVSRQLGHANPNITATIYAHLLGDSQLDEAAAVFELQLTRRVGRDRKASKVRLMSGWPRCRDVPGAR